MSNGEIGRVKILPKLRGQHNSNQSYAKMDEVYHNGSIYQAQQNIPAGVAITDSRWVLRLDNSQAYNAIDRANAISGTMEGIAPKWADVDISASGLAAGADPTASVTQDVGGTHLTVGIPKGDKGDKGDTGNVMYATFDIDFDTGELVMTIPDGYTGPTFAINDETGELEVSI